MGRKWREGGFTKPIGTVCRLSVPCLLEARAGSESAVIPHMQSGSPSLGASSCRLPLCLPVLSDSHVLARSHPFALLLGEAQAPVPVAASRSGSHWTTPRERLPAPPQQLGASFLLLIIPELICAWSRAACAQLVGASPQAERKCSESKSKCTGWFFPLKSGCQSLLWGWILYV